MTKRIVLTALEIEAVIGVAGNAEPYETFVDEGEADARKLCAAYERGMDKLREMLARKEGQS